MNRVYKETKWQVFKHRFGIMPRVGFSNKYTPYNNWLSKKLWRFWKFK